MERSRGIILQILLEARGKLHVSLQGLLRHEAREKGERRHRRLGGCLSRIGGMHYRALGFAAGRGLGHPGCGRGEECNQTDLRQAAQS